MHEAQLLPDEIAIFGGSFDPPTISHVDIMKDLLTLPFDEVWVMPSGDRADKQITTGETTRLAMLTLVKNQLFENENRLRISGFELELPKPSRTIDTYDALAKAYPNAQFTFVIGADSYKTLPHWHDGLWLMNNLSWIVYTRDGYKLEEADFPDNFAQARNQIDSHSSTQVRELVANGGDFEEYVVASIAKFIKEREMYV